MKIETIAIHAGNHVDPSSRAAIQPITLSTTFQRGEDGGYPGGYMYTRIANPNRTSLENVLAKLEHFQPGSIDAVVIGDQDPRRGNIDRQAAHCGLMTSSPPIYGRSVSGTCTNSGVMRPPAESGA